MGEQEAAAREAGREFVTLTVDGVEIQAPKGANLIEAAKLAGVEVPHYCYHSHLSIAGNCRMCQMKVQGSPKLTIGCNTQATQGMVVQTHRTSEEVADAQRATLEFLLINHPIDCTVCDQAGHCKLQDYYFEYNAKASRFIEEKEHKVKAEKLGPEVIYDGERCILCTRCVRFCSEVTETSELGVLNRGDKSVIAVFPGKELDNPLSGTVVDLCPVGALTHRRWRFNTRIWYTKQADTICPGCSTGCNVKIAVRDNEVVHVKARLNSEVNKEWMCDEGRYGFSRFQPDVRLQTPLINASIGESSTHPQVSQTPNEISAKQIGPTMPIFNEITWADAFAQMHSLKANVAENTADDAALFLSPFLTLEEMWLAVEFAERVMGITRKSGNVAISYRERTLSAVEKVLVSPDYAPNIYAARVLGLIDNSAANWRDAAYTQYDNLLGRIRSGAVARVLFVGDGSLWAIDLDEALQSSLVKAFSVSLLPRDFDAYPLVFASDRFTDQSKDRSRGLSCGFHSFSKIVLPSQTVLEKNGLMVNASGRVQKMRQLLKPPEGSVPEWIIIKRIAEALGIAGPWNIDEDERGLSREMLKQVPALQGLSLFTIGDGGVCC